MNRVVNPMIADLGAGLILRRSSPADAEALAGFCARIQGGDPDEPEANIGAWTRDLLTRPHPTFPADAFTVVEEVATGRIISTMNLIPQTWTYDGIVFGVGRPELVGTLPEFRHRGLVRRQFEEIHRWSATRGDLVHAITGIPFYYRQFGYEMALDLDGQRSAFAPNVPILNAGENEPYVFRPAADTDIPFMSSVYDQGCLRSPLACVRDEEIWRYELKGRSEPVTSLFLIIERTDREPVGLLRHWPTLGKVGLVCRLFELKPGVCWIEVAPSVVRYLWKTGQEFARREDRQCTAVTFALGESHPVYEALEERLPGRRQSYAWYLRVADVPRFIRRIAPALEKRLAQSLACGYSGEKLLSFYRSGLRLTFQDGRLKLIEPWMPGPGQREGHIAFPGLAFLQLLFGYRSLAELRQSFADCWWDSNETRVLFNALFPRKPSDIYPLS